MRSILYFLSVGVVFLFSHKMFAQHHRLVGYLPYYQFSQADKIEFEKMTHLCLAFANPDSQGNLNIGGKNITPIVETAHNAGVDVLISLAGGALTPEWWTNWQELTLPSNRSEFIHKTIEYLYEHNLQGVDMDLEWQYIKDWYSPYVLELKDSLVAHDMLFTAALPGTYRYPDITDEALAAYDFINMMVYDLTGPWNPDNPGQHSPFSFAENSIKYWRDKQEVPPENLTLGIPFYGWNFDNQDDIFSFTYRSMVDRNPINALKDNIGQAYYNGILTVRKKTQLAMEQVSGIMIWELGQDHFSEQFSLLNAVYGELKNGTSLIHSASDLKDFKIYPNPFSDQFYIKNNSADELKILLSDARGHLIIRSIISGFSEKEIQTQYLPKGVYFLKSVSNTGAFNSKVLIKQ